MSTPTTRRLGDERHKCPKDGCTKMMPHDRLACRPHWFSISFATRKRVLFAWAGGRGIADTAYLEARAVAVAELNGVRHCVKCGCTDEHACVGGCSWVTADRCSRCAPNVAGILGIPTS